MIGNDGLDVGEEIPEEYEQLAALPMIPVGDPGGGTLAFVGSPGDMAGMPLLTSLASGWMHHFTNLEMLQDGETSSFADPSFPLLLAVRERRYVPPPPFDVTFTQAVYYTGPNGTYSTATRAGNVGTIEVDVEGSDPSIVAFGPGTLSGLATSYTWSADWWNGPHVAHVFGSVTTGITPFFHRFGDLEDASFLADWATARAAGGTYTAPASGFNYLGADIPAEYTGPDHVGTSDLIPTGFVFTRHYAGDGTLLSTSFVGTDNAEPDSMVIP